MQLNNCLRKIAAILLALLLLFNWFGYRLYTGYLQKKADKTLQARLDENNYRESELIEIRIPLNMPYQNNSSDFERHYGEVKLDGKIFSYVKRKVENGTLVLKCIPNNTKQEIKEADNILFTANNGLDQEKNGNSNSPLQNIFKTLLTDFDTQQQNYDLRGSQVLLANFFNPQRSALQEVSLPVAGQPPERV